MGIYCYKIGRKSRVIHGLPNAERAYKAEFAFKTSGWSGDDEHAYQKRVAPTRRAWENHLGKSGQDISDIFFVYDFEDNAEVYQRDSVDWIDTNAPGRLVGKLRRMSGTRSLRFVPAREKRFDVEFSTYDHVVPVERVTITVDATCTHSAKAKALDVIRGNAEFHLMKQRPDAVEVRAQKLSRNELLEKALDSVKADRSLPLSVRVEVRDAIKQAMAA